jgi:hypothetical protein
MFGIKYLLLAVILCSSTSLLAAEVDDSCESAVDAADKLGSPINKECDYSNTGLNGVLHRAVVNKEKVVIDKTSNNEVSVKASSKNMKTAADIVPSDSATNNVAKPLVRLISAEFGTVQQLATARYELIRTASQDCPIGFILDKESYLPAKNKLLKLQLTYSCL